MNHIYLKNTYGEKILFLNLNYDSVEKGEGKAFLNYFI